MKFKRLYLLVLGLSIICTSFRQKPLGGRLWQVAVKGKVIMADNFNNVYVIGVNNDIYIYNSKGELKFTQNFKVYGNLYSIDASNPLELYLFYKDVNTVVFTDNTLAIRGVTDLSVDGLLPSAIARSYDNGLWVWDMGDQQLKKMNKNREITQVSGNASMIAGKNLSPTYIYDSGNAVYVNDTANGILVFDLFANYQKTLPIKGIQKFSLVNGMVNYMENNFMQSYELKTYQKKSIEAPFFKGTEVAFTDRMLYILNNDTLQAYTR
jgi:hypothetical protein